MAGNKTISKREVVVVAPMPPEKSAYALARYSRSADSVKKSLEWVRGHDSAKFLDSFYFQYGHASIADLGHCTFCFEGVSELAAIEIEDEQLWDGQAKSSRYQDFAANDSILIKDPAISWIVVVPAELASGDAKKTYWRAADALLGDYGAIHAALRGYLTEKHPKPEGMKPGVYRRTIDARAHDSARYLLFTGISTNVGQVTSIRTLEKQMRKLGVSEYGEIRGIAREMRKACAASPTCVWHESQANEPVAPTLAKYAKPDKAAAAAYARVAAWARQNFNPGAYEPPRDVDVDLIPACGPLDETVASWLYAVTAHPFRVILEEVSGWSRALRQEVLDEARKRRGRGRRDELAMPFRSGYSYIFDVVTDIGAYRDLHRHRRCQQIRQRFSGDLGCARPEHVDAAGVGERYDNALKGAEAARKRIAATSEPASHYLLPFAARCRSLYKMDFAEAEYISRVRSGVKGHIAYRKVAWEMRERILERDPELGRLIKATPPSEEDPLTR